MAVANTGEDDAATRVVWILTQRVNATLWANSVLHWHSITERLERALLSTNTHQKSSSSSTTTASMLELPQPVTQEQVVTSLEESIQRARDSQRWTTRQAFFKATYERHLEHVRQTARKLDVPLIEVMVDHDDNNNDDTAQQQQQQHPAALLVQALEGHGVILGQIPQNNDKDASSCWTWEASRIDDDWRDFSFPF